MEKAQIKLKANLKIMEDIWEIAEALFSNAKDRLKFRKEWFEVVKYLKNTYGKDKNKKEK